MARGASRLSDHSSDDFQTATDVRRAVPREVPTAEEVEGALRVLDAVHERRCGDHKLWS